MRNQFLGIRQVFRRCVVDELERMHALLKCFLPLPWPYTGGDISRFEGSVCCTQLFDIESSPYAFKVGFSLRKESAPSFSNVNS